MLTRLIAVLLASLPITGMLEAQNATTIKKVPLAPTSPSSAEEMFHTYCAVCHGKDGKGAGPAVSALKVAPPDLTQLAAKNQGKFPEDSVYMVLTEGSNIVAHGSEEMPVWGDLFRSLHPGRADIVQLRIANLTHYLKTIQRK
jgi:mono/diheme cytochrome c family protein